jgi:hypothetical protein
MKDAFGDHGQDEVALATGMRGQQGVQAEAAGSAEDGFDMAMGKAALNEEGAGGGDEPLAGQGAADEVDEGGGKVGDVAKGLVLDLRADAEGAAEEVGMVELAFVEAFGCGYMNAAMSG